MAAAQSSLQPLKLFLPKVFCRNFFSESKVTYSKLSLLRNVWRLSYAAHHSSAETLKFESQPRSWLFVSGSVAGAYGSQVNLQLDLDTRLSGKNLKCLESNVKARNLAIDVNSLASDLFNLRLMEEKKKSLTSEKGDIATEIARKRNEYKGRDDDFAKATKVLTERLTEIKQQLRDLKVIWEIEEDIILRGLKLPNYLHPTTPLTDALVVKDQHAVQDKIAKSSHIEIGKKHNLIKFSNVGPKAYYLKGVAARAELALSTYVINYFLDHKYHFIAGPEFFKTPIMEGCGYDVRNPNEVLTMLNAGNEEEIEPLNHLAGISPASFVAYVAKCCIGDKALPLNMFACGRSYHNSHLPGLYGANQTTEVGVFSCLLPEHVDKHFEQTAELIWHLLAPLNFPIRLSLVKAADLQRAESRRLEVQIYAPSIQNYIPIAHVSDLSDYVSCRLMVRHNLNHADYRFAPMVHMVSGSAVNITSLLAAWMEYSDNTNSEQFNFLPLPGL